MCPCLTDQLAEKQRETKDEVRPPLPKLSDLGG
jgi:hypothetical protein